jgi:osmotically-inducible protein OsmY
VRKLTGVHNVVNDITVTPGAKPADVREKIRAALDRHVSVEVGNIGIDVSGGKVTLTGKVNAWTERQIIEQAAWAVPGVTEVDDRIDLVRP